MVGVFSVINKQCQKPEPPMPTPISLSLESAATPVKGLTQDPSLWRRGGGGGEWRRRGERQRGWLAPVFPSSASGKERGCLLPVPELAGIKIMAGVTLLIHLSFNHLCFVLAPSPNTTAMNVNALMGFLSSVHD